MAHWPAISPEVINSLPSLIRLINTLWSCLQSEHPLRTVKRESLFKCMQKVMDNFPTNALLNKNLTDMDVAALYMRPYCPKGHRCCLSCSIAKSAKVYPSSSEGSVLRV